ncbi:RDD family protein [Streptococcus rifensis]
MVYRGSNRLSSALLRNVLKFLPWQFGHMATIHVVFKERFDLMAMVLNVFSLTLLTTITLMALLRKDKRHLGDLLARTQVQLVN